MGSLRFRVAAFQAAACAIITFWSRVSASTVAKGTSAATKATPNAAAVNAAWKANSSCCQALALSLPGKISTPSGEPYKSSIASYWSLQEQGVSPACVVIPESNSDVSIAVIVLAEGSKILNNEGCKFAIRGGGHTPWAGSANIQGGITIDLSGLNEIIVSSNQTQVSIGAGNRWESVYLKLDALGLSTSGGRVSSVGVGGLTLGGGISFFSPRYGLVCDNVINFEIVLASGDTVNANSTSYPDLFQALKGGSNNFGIVTNFKMRAFTQGKFWGGFIGHNISTRFQQFQYFETFARSSTYDPYAALINSYSHTASEGWYIASDFEYTKPEAYPAVFKNFTDLPQTFSTMRISNLTDFTTEIEEYNPAGSRELFATATFANNATMQEKFFDLANQTVQSITNVTKMTLSMSFQPLPQVIIGHGAFNGGNSLGLDLSDGDLVNVLLTIQWADEADDAAVNNAAQNLFSRAETASKTMGTHNPYLYLNYAADFQNPIAGYGNESYSTLKAVSQKYDPGQLFQKQVPGGFKLPESGAYQD